MAIFPSWESKDLVSHCLANNISMISTRFDSIIMLSINIFTVFVTAENQITIKNLWLLL